MSAARRKPSIDDWTRGQTERITVTATEAQNEFGRILDSAAQDRVVVITRHNAPRAVLISFEKYNALITAGATVLDTLTGEFDVLLDRLQSPAAQAALRQAFSASPAALGQAAVADARHSLEGGE